MGLKAWVLSWELLASAQAQFPYESLFLVIARRAVKLASVRVARESPHFMLLKDTPAMGEVMGRSGEHRIEVALTEEDFNACSGPPRGAMEFATHTFMVSVKLEIRRSHRGDTYGRRGCC